MVRTFWHTNRIRNPKSSTSGCVDSALELSSDAQKVSYTILQDYQNDMKKRFRTGGAPAKWKEWLESQKTGSRKATVKSSSDESTTASSLNGTESLQLQAPKVPSLSPSSASALEWRMEAFLLSSEDYQRFTSSVVITLYNGLLHFYV